MMTDYHFPAPGTPIHMLPTPALVIDLDRMEANLALMASFFARVPAKLRPHFKTHKCPILAKKQVEYGAIGITCAKLGEAEVLVDAGIQSILIANEIVDPVKIQRLAELAGKTEIIVAVDNLDNLAQLSKTMSAAGVTVGVVIEVDVGLHRCGVLPGAPALALARQAVGMPGIAFRGVMGYEGHTVLVADADRRVAGTHQAMDELVNTAVLIRAEGIPVEIVTGGGTGTYNLTGAHAGVTEVEAGSYPFMDTEYRRLGLPFENALSLLATVISVPTAERAVTDAGMKVLSSDNGLPEIIAPRGIRLRSLHEEHGLVDLLPDSPRICMGDRIELLPSHVCTTVNLHDYFYAVRKGVLEAVWPIAGRGKSQ
jgi:D-serine deaminase-like pyridoxal phosphate-dependent protein